MLHLFLGYGLAMLTALFVLGGDYLIKIEADGDLPLTSRHMVGGSLIYAASAFLWLVCMRHATLAQAGVAFSMFSLLALCGLGVWFFDEKLHAREALGIVCALLAMMLMVRIA
ncbi:MAG: hypothetical protein AB3N21_12245 [Ruegeria sp.]|uniref:hypothetical protein n=1 Tax=Ruegeria sp. TaxID=1879320 RepID=UPI00349E75EE